MIRPGMPTLGLVALLTLGLARAGDTTDRPACSAHGTTIDFYDTPAEAARQARKEGKLVFVLHVSGNFENPRFT